jgi:hypothetical protein
LDRSFFRENPVSPRLLICLAVLAACTPREEATPAADSTAAATAPREAERLHAIAGFSTPESVIHDSVADVYFVSNISGNPSAKDNNGFISRLRPDGTIDSLRFVSGGRNGVSLHAPKGMAITGDTLWVTDIDVVCGFNRVTGAAVATVTVGSRARFLNDLAVGPDGSIYATETGIRISPEGALEPTGLDAVFRIQGRRVTVAVRDSGLSAPNGITWSGGRLLIASARDSALHAWTDGGTLERIGSTAGGADGLDVLADGRIIGSSWADSTVSVVGDSVYRLISGLVSPADFGLDRRRGHLVVPLFQADRVEIWRLP